MLKNITCIACPRGCELTIGLNNDEPQVSGYRCPKGLEYGKQEAVCPLRMLTTTIPRKNGGRVPVKTSAEVPLKDIPEYMKEIRTLCAQEQVTSGDIVSRKLLGKEIDLIATGGPS